MECQKSTVRKPDIWVNNDLLKLLEVDLIKNHPERKLLIAILQYTGERIGTVLQLRVKDCYKDGKPRKEILFKRTYKGDIYFDKIPVHPQLSHVLKGFIPPETGYLFPSPKNLAKPVTYSNCHRWFHNALGKAGLSSKNYSWRSFSRTFNFKKLKRLTSSI